MKPEHSRLESGAKLFWIIILHRQIGSRGIESPNRFLVENQHLMAGGRGGFEPSVGSHAGFQTDAIP